MTPVCHIMEVVVTAVIRHQMARRNVNVQKNTAWITFWVTGARCASPRTTHVNLTNLCAGVENVSTTDGCVTQTSTVKMDRTKTKICVVSTDLKN